MHQQQETAMTTLPPLTLGMFFMSGHCQLAKDAANWCSVPVLKTGHVNILFFSLSSWKSACLLPVHVDVSSFCLLQKMHATWVSSTSVIILYSASLIYTMIIVTKINYFLSSILYPQHDLLYTLLNHPNFMLISGFDKILKVAYSD